MRAGMLVISGVLAIWASVAKGSTAAHTAGGAETQPTQWRELQVGVEYAVIGFPSSVDIADKRLHVVRIDPARARLVALLATQNGRAPRAARQWSTEFNLAAVINLGMYQTDHLTNVGYLRNGAHLNNSHWAEKYKAAFAFNPKTPGLAPAIMADLDQADGPRALESYETVVQNLRLIKAPGQNVWENQPKRWSEAALAADTDGRILFVFCRTPLSMWELNRLLLRLPLRISRAMHMEGGPEASLSIHAGGVDLDLSGSFETGFSPTDANLTQWPIPNVLGVSRVK